MKFECYTELRLHDPFKQSIKIVNNPLKYQEGYVDANTPRDCLETRVQLI